jgi:hypothetical protein
MPAIITCAACQTKLKVPENSAAKALRCPKCKGTVPIPAATPRPAPTPPEEEEFEVNEAVDEKEEEFEVNEAANEEEELEVNEAADEEEESADEEGGDDDHSELLTTLGFAKGKDPFKVAQVPDDARKAIEKSFVKKEHALWIGRPESKIIESKAWLGFVVGGFAMVVGVSVCLGTTAGAIFGATETMMRVVLGGIGALFLVFFGGIGLLAIIFRKRIGGNVSAIYVLTNKRAYVYDGIHQVRAFTPHQLEEMKCVESAKFPGAGDLVFAYDFMGDAGVQVSKESAQKYGTGQGQSNPVGFLAIADVQAVRDAINGLLVEPNLDKAEAKAKAKKKKAKERSRYKPFG